MKSLKNLLVPFVILLALMTAAVVYLIVDSVAKNKPSDDTPAGLIEVVYYNTQDLMSVSVYNRESGHTTTVKSSLTTDGYIYYDYAGDDRNADDKYSQNALSGFVNDLSVFNCTSKVSGKGNYSDYGLADPAYTVTLNATNGSVTTIYIGDLSPDGEYCYIYLAGSEDIYAISASKRTQVDKKAIDFLESVSLGIDYSNLDKVHFDRKTDGLSLDTSVVMTDSGIANFMVYKPYEHPASSYFGLMIDRIVALEVKEYIAVDKSDLSAYGLDDPTYHFILTMKDGSKTELFISSYINNVYYAYVSGNDKCFMLDKNQLEGIDLKELVLIDPYVNYCYVSKFSSITGTYGEQSFKLSLDVQNGQSINSEGAIVELNGRNAQIFDSEGRSYCSILFESLACIKIGGVETGADVNTSAGPVISFSFNDKSYNSTVFDFYQRDTDSFYVLKDGKYTGFFVYSTELFNDGGYDTYTYGCWRAYELLNEAISNSINGVYDMPEEE